MGPLGPIYTIDEAAAALRVSRRTFSDLIKKHPHYHLNGRKKLFDVADLEAIWDAMRPGNHPHKGQVLEAQAPSSSDESVYESLRRSLVKKGKQK
ncbi:helix-turn-helix domain-containing protein [Xanthobacter autotrophicus]|uniref:helix-turn-helix domain-containing protein n=1 Tax=Xanthobacter autotrophicus TaxID=280 RepID=UPI0037264ECD